MGGFGELHRQPKHFNPALVSVNWPVGTYCRSWHYGLNRQTAVEFAIKCLDGR